MKSSVQLLVESQNFLVNKHSSKDEVKMLPVYLDENEEHVIVVSEQNIKKELLNLYSNSLIIYGNNDLFLNKNHSIICWVKNDKVNLSYVSNKFVNTSLNKTEIEIPFDNMIVEHWKELKLKI